MNDAAMKRLKRWGIPAGFILGIIATVVFGFVAYRSIGLAEDAALGIRHAERVRLAATSLQATTARAQLDRRGFLLRGDPSMRDRYDARSDTVFMRFDTLRALTRDDPLQARRIDRLGDLLRRADQVGRQSIDMRQAAGLEQVA